MRKRAIAALLSLIMAVSTLPLAAFAEDQTSSSASQTPEAIQNELSDDTAELPLQQEAQSTQELEKELSEDEAFDSSDTAQQATANSETSTEDTPPRYRSF